MLVMAARWSVAVLCRASYCNNPRPLILSALLLFDSVCNGDYGDNTFHGVNEILVFGGSITASVAKLNEYYMKSATEARKQYTMCHGTYLLCTLKAW